MAELRLTEEALRWLEDPNLIVVSTVLQVVTLSNTGLDI